MCSRLPLVVILGATGSGKTKLSIELAQKFGGEIIGADSMQVYKGLDIITAKVTKEEQLLARHHLIDLLEPNQNCTVLDYRDNVLKVLDDLEVRNKLPIVVGGTNYYIESLLWKILVEQPGEKLETKLVIPPNNYHELSSKELHDKLKVLDPTMAKRLHPNNKRKILRSLEILHQKGQLHSDILKDQQLAKGASRSGGGLRFSNVFILWVQCDKIAHEQRLDARVDKMMEQGLMKELLDFQVRYSQMESKPPDYTKGVFQSIGFKEFHPFLILDESEKDTPKSKQIIEDCVKQLKLVTRRYAKKQIRWINNRFLGRLDREVPPVYGLDASDVSLWNTKVYEPACEIVESYINRTECKHERLQFNTCSVSTPNSEETTYFCKTCDRVFVGSYQWGIHMKSGNHYRMVRRKQKQ